MPDLLNGQSDSPLVVVVTAATGGVLAVLGPFDGEVEANAARDVLRRSEGENATVKRLRAPNIRDLHGEGFDA